MTVTRLILSAAAQAIQYAELAHTYRLIAVIGMSVAARIVRELSRPPPLRRQPGPPGESTSRMICSTLWSSVAARTAFTIPTASDMYRGPLHLHCTDSDAVKERRRLARFVIGGFGVGCSSSSV